MGLDLGYRSYWRFRCPVIRPLTKSSSCEACSGFTSVTAHRIAQPPKATFVTRLRPFRSPGRAARQLPDQSTILWVDSSSTGDSRLRGALPLADMRPRGAELRTRITFAEMHRFIAVAACEE